MTERVGPGLPKPATLDLWVGRAAMLFGLLAIASSGGCHLVPQPGGPVVGALWAVFAVAGCGAGLWAMRRGRDLDVERWQALEEPLLTSQEREYIHKRAESERRRVATRLLLALLAAAFWVVFLAVQASWVRDTLPLAALGGFGLGLLLGARRYPAPTGPFDG